MATQITIQTTKGDIHVRLYDETPIHRDNFLRLCREGYYDQTLFHRVIRDFMIQGGDPDSRTAAPGQQLGMGGPDYTLQAEILPHLIHRRGALAAARQGDEVNPERRSSGSQFYIVWGQQYTEGQIGGLERQMQMMAEQQCFQTLVAKHRDEIMAMRRNRDREGLSALQDRLATEAHQMARDKGGLSPEQRQAYTTEGGTPHLDGQYTVFGQVTEGLDVVQAIQESPTLRGDRPKEDIRILSTVVTEE